MSDGFELFSVTELVEQLSLKKITPNYLIEYLLQKTEKLEKLIHAYTIINPQIRDRRLIEKASNRGPLYGLPVAVKDLVDTKGIETSYGSTIFAGHVPDRDALVVSRIKKNGGIIFGKTVTHEFALGIVSSPTRNPWDRSRIPGGSSGGSAAAVACGEAFFAVGSDTGGSIRIPAAMCGVTGMKPSYGKIPCIGVFPEAWSLDHLGPMTRYAKDLALELKAMGYDVLAKLTNARLRKRLRLGVIEEFVNQTSKPLRSVVRAAIDKLLSESIVEEEPVPNLPFSEMLKMHEIVDTSEIATVHTFVYAIYPKNKEKYLKESVEQIEQGLHNSAVEYIHALRSMKKYRAILSDVFKKVDCLLCPTLPSIAPKPNEVADLAKIMEFVKFLAPFNYTGNPAITVPCGFVEGLPVGLQIISDYGRDELAILLAERFQEVTDWHTKLPQL